MITTEKLNTIATAVQTVEALANTAVAATGAAPTGAQKAQAAIAIATAVDPSLNAQITPVMVIINSLVNVFKLFGIFKSSAPAPAPAPIAPTSAPVAQ